jgi:hypothetical protein
MQWFAPRSAIDLGCGRGEWLAVFQASGVAEIQGLDGSHVDPNRMAIPASAFVTHDFTQPYRGERRYDLAMSVEVAEHLEPAAGAALVHSLTDLSDVVLFSAAAPHQAGVHHVNCQWPVYWSRLFRERSYVAVDAIRRRIWNNSAVDWWYRQNLLLYIRDARLKSYPVLAVDCTEEPLALVHPEMLRSILEWGLELDRKYWQLWREHQPPSAAAETRGAPRTDS